VYNGLRRKEEAVPVLKGDCQLTESLTEYLNKTGTLNNAEKITMILKFSQVTR